MAAIFIRVLNYRLYLFKLTVSHKNVSFVLEVKNVLGLSFFLQLKTLEFHYFKISGINITTGVLKLIHSIWTLFSFVNHFTARPNGFISNAGFKPHIYYPGESSIFLHFDGLNKENKEEKFLLTFTRSLGVVVFIGTNERALW